MQLYQGEPEPGPGDSGELADVASNVAPYPILMHLPYLPETARPVRSRTVKKAAPASKTVNYEDPSTPPPVRTPRREQVVAPEVVETPITLSVGAEIVSDAPVVKTPASEKVSEAPAPVATTPETEPTPAPPTPVARGTHGKLVACCLLVVIAGLCVHWHWASVAPYCKSPQRVLDLIHAREATEMVIVPADGAPMLAEPIAAPAAAPVACEAGTCEKQDCPKPAETASAKPEAVQAAEAAKPPETTVAKPEEETKRETVVAQPIEATKPAETVIRTTLPEPQRLPDAIVIETIAAKITIPLPPPPAETATPRGPVGPIVPVSAAILKPMLVTPANYWVPEETSRTPEIPVRSEAPMTPEASRTPEAPPTPSVDVNIKAGPVEADFGVDILPVDEGSTP
jgi:hypothetical protein